MDKLTPVNTSLNLKLESPPQAILSEFIAYAFRKQE